MRVGDLANVFVLANSGAFVALVLLQEAGAVDIFSASFLRDGFCVAAPDTWRSSHALCFYADAVGAVVVAALARHFAGAPWVDAVAKAGPAILMHGVAHFGIWYHGDAGGLRGRADAVGAPRRAFRLAALAVFFFLLLRSAPRVPDRHAAGLAAGLAAVQALFVPPAFGFTYVQTSLLWVAAVYDLARDDKDRAYDVFACVVSAPVGVVAWCEGLGCDAFFKAAGGHVWPVSRRLAARRRAKKNRGPRRRYDAVIPVSMVAYFGACATVLGSDKAGKAA